MMKLAFRNLLKNRRRSLMTVVAIASGYAAVNLFQGYTHNIYAGLTDQVTKGQGSGHLTLFKRGFLKEGKLHPERHLFTAEEIARIRGLLHEDPKIQLITPQLFMTGLISNGKASTIFIAQGIVAEDEKILRGEFRDRPGLIDPSLASGAAVASDLAELLGLKPGDDAVLLTTTIEGSANALDVQVQQVYNTGVGPLNDKFLKLHFSYAQKLYDTDGADRLILLLDDISHTDSAKERLTEMLFNSGFQIEVKTWYELSLFYEQVRRMFDMIFLFISLIVLFIVVMSVMNTMGTAVVERTREIGTLRALGLRRFGVVRLFGIEGTLLGLFGSALGLLMTVAGIFALKASNVMYIPPNQSEAIPLLVDLVPSSLVGSLIGLILLSMLSSVFPARRASRMVIVDALGHV